MKRILILCLLWGIWHLACAQTITIRDQENKRPVPMATLSSENPKASAVTNNEGQADISAFKRSELIEVRTPGYYLFITSYARLAAANFEIVLEPGKITLDNVVVSATRWRQASGWVPSKIISITSKEVALQNPQTAADLLGLSGKVFIQKSQQGGGSPMIRGFATNRLLYTVDGVRMNTAIFRAGNIQNVINVDPFAVEKTEVLFGPGSVIYGSDAIGGVMSFQTLTPQLALNNKPLIAGKALARYASANNEKTAHFDINAGWKKWALVTSISSWDFDHLRQGSHGPEDYLKRWYVQRQNNEDRVIIQDDPLLQIPSAYSQLNLMQKLRYQPNDKLDIQYAFHYSETSPYGRYDRHNRQRNGGPRYAEWDYGPQLWMMNNLNITYAKANPLFDQMSARLAVQKFEESRMERSLNNNSRNTQTEKVHAWSANVDFNKQTTSKNTLYYGLEYVLNDVASTGKLTNIAANTTQAGPSRYPQAKWHSMAVYLNDEFKVSDKFTLQGGLRYNQYLLDASFDTTFYKFPFTAANINNGALTGSIGAVYRPSASWAISANFGTAFRSPNVDDLGKVFDSQPGAVTVPNPGVEAEYAYNFDLGIAKIFAEVIKLDLTGYYTNLQHALVLRNFQLNGKDSILYGGVNSRVLAVQNAARANVYGLQAGLEIKFPAGFGFSADVNYQKGEEELDNGTVSPSRHAAPFFGTARLSYNTGPVSLQWFASYQAEKPYSDLPQEEQAKDEIYAKDANGKNYSPSWYTLNFKALYQVTEHFSVSAGMENITDQRYRPYSSGISAAGRNFMLALRANF